MMQNRGKELTPIGKPGHKKSRIIQYCQIEGCIKKYEARGYCKYHYQLIITLPKQKPKPAKLPRAPRAPREPRYCIVEGCDNTTLRKELCGKHYTRLRKHGDVHCNYANNHKHTKNSIVNKPLQFTHSHEEVMILNEFFNESIGLHESEYDY
jgi:hypothetical protein